MSYPTLKPNSSWFTPTLDTTKRNLITVINADNGKILAVVNGIWTAVSLINSEEVSY